MLTGPDLNSNRISKAIKEVEQTLIDAYGAKRGSTPILAEELGGRLLLTSLLFQEGSLLVESRWAGSNVVETFPLSSAPLHLILKAVGALPSLDATLSANSDA